MGTRASSYGLESCMQKCKPKCTLLLPVNMDGLTGGGGLEKYERHCCRAIPKEQMSHT